MGVPPARPAGRVTEDDREEEIMVRALTTAALLVVLLAGAGARAQTYAVMDMIGYLFESDNAPGEQGFPPSDAGDV